MNINDLLNNMPSLINYMGQDRKGAGSIFGFRSQTNNALQIINNQQQAANSAYLLDLSPEAQKRLAQSQAGGGSSDPIKGAQKHFINFFEENGVDLDNLSTEATKLLKGLVEFLGESETTGRDNKTDALEFKASKGERNAFTLTGNNRRIRIAIEQTNDGQNMLTLTDIHDNKADIAQMVIGEEDGKTLITLTRSEETFAYGRKIDRQEQPAVTIKT